MSKIRSAGVAAVFLAGCAVGGASALVVPKASAQQAKLPRWEYACVNEGGDEMIEPANRLGAEGWELAAVQSKEIGYAAWCFKRQKM